MLLILSMENHRPELGIFPKTSLFLHFVCLFVPACLCVFVSYSFLYFHILTYCKPQIASATWFRVFAFSGSLSHDKYKSFYGKK